MKIGRIVKDQGGGYHIGVCIFLKTPEERTDEYRDNLISKLFELFPDAQPADHDHYLVHSRHELSV